MASSPPEKAYVKNKLAQIVSTVFVVDYPTVWPTFFSDMMQYSTCSSEAADMYLRILKAIDTDVVDREVSHTIQVGLRDSCSFSALFLLLSGS